MAKYYFLPWGYEPSPITAILRVNEKTGLAYYKSDNNQCFVVHIPTAYSLNMYMSGSPNWGWSEAIYFSPSGSEGFEDDLIKQFLA